MALGPAGRVAVGTTEPASAPMASSISPIAAQGSDRSSAPVAGEARRVAVARASARGPDSVYS